MSEHEPTTGTSRRAFLSDLARLGVGASALGACAQLGIGGVGGSSGGASDPRADRIGLQLYTVRDQLQQSFDGTLERIAAIGYKEMEFAGYYGRTPEQVRAVLDRLGLTAPSAHIGTNLLRDSLQEQIRVAKIIGHQYVTAPSHNFGRAAGEEGYKQAAALFNQWGKALRDAGLKFAYHNHDREWMPIGGGRSGMEVLLAETDPALVEYELDLYWTVFAGRDPLQLFRQFPGRFTMWHVKDLRESTGTKTMTPVGQGSIDFKAIFAQARQSGLRHFFVEHDNAAQFTGGSLASVEASFRHLRQLLA